MLTMTFFDALTSRKAASRPAAGRDRALEAWYRGYAHLFAAPSRKDAAPRRSGYDLPGYCG